MTRKKISKDKIDDVVGIERSDPEVPKPTVVYEARKNMYGMKKYPRGGSLFLGDRR